MRLRQHPTAAGDWIANRDAELERHRRAGIGLRPPAWWLFEARRPDLAAGAGLDVYNHLRPESREFERSKERLRYLDETGELTEQERRSIAEGVGPGYEWRREVLRDG